jgi:hypothetical protein
MKNFRLIITIAVLIAVLGIILTSCRFGRHTVIVENGNGHELRIESYGKVHFNRDGNGIAYISSGGYLDYKNDNKELRAENGPHGSIKYELTDNGRKLNPDSSEQFIAEAVYVMIQKGYHSN